MARNRKRIERPQDRTYGQRYHRQHQKAVFWKHHLDCWAQTSLTQAAYCENNGLSQSSFSRWKALLTPKEPKTKRRAGDAKILVDRPYYEAKALCTYCGTPNIPHNQLFFGPDETVSICANCVFQKYRQYLVENEHQCMICKMTAPWDSPLQETHTVRDYLRLCRACLLSFVDHAQQCFSTQMTCNFCDFPPAEASTQHIMISTKSGLFRVCGKCIDLLFRQKQLDMRRGTCLFCGTSQSEDDSLVSFRKGAMHVCKDCIKVLSSYLGSQDA